VKKQRFEKFTAGRASRPAAQSRPSIARQLVEARRRTVTAENRPTGGAFSIRLPLANRCSCRWKQRMKHAALIIDDECKSAPPSPRARRRRLPGCKTDAGQAGWSGGKPPSDVILLDLGLPDMEGTEVLKRLREWTDTPVLILSVRDEIGKVEALDAGADDYVTKPFSTASFAPSRRAENAGRRGSVGLQHGDLTVDLARTVSRRGHEVKLTATNMRCFVCSLGMPDGS
jgi:CheY-like chemotaxis protein